MTRGIASVLRPAALGAGVFLSTAGAARAQDQVDLSQLAGFIQWGGVAASVVVFILALALLRGLEHLSATLCARFVSRRPTIQMVESASRFIVYLLTIVIAVRLSLRMDATALTVIGGGLAFAVGFAMRDLVAAVIAGITIMFDRPFQVGDRVEYAGQYGDVIKIGLRSVRMNTLDHNVITIPNNKVLTDVTSSGNYGALEMQVPFGMVIGADEDLELAMSLVQEACLTSPYAYLDKPAPVFARNVLEGNFVMISITARPYVFEAKYEKSFETDVTLRIRRAFREHGIAGPTVVLARA
ncbi:mechanosensitive ion channel family protein [Brevundimonas sp.]|uniref:mechanosensitive ion channel family protein n=1 Tax=Brevundimonas sp. TaxID=1871086 RepID=UPI003A8DF895